MSKPAKTEAELIAMARAELKVHADCPDGIVISVLRDVAERADEVVPVQDGACGLGSEGIHAIQISCTGPEARGAADRQL